MVHYKENTNRKSEFRNQRLSESPVLILQKRAAGRVYGDLNSSFLIPYLFISLLS
jgi:hypothetical protein